MSSLYEHVCEILDIPDKRSRIKAMEKITEEKRTDSETLSSSEVNDLYSRTLQYLNTGCVDTYNGILVLIAFAGSPNPENSLVSILHETSADPRMFQVESIRFELMRQNDITTPDEIPLYYDLVRMFPGDGAAYRRGTCVVTSKRIILFGVHNGPAFHDATVYRLVYDDLENRKYLESIDYLELGRIESVTSEWSWRKKQIVIQYRTRYVKEKGRTIYGPFFFKADLPKKVTVEEGVLPIIIRLHNLPFPGAPKDFLRKRQDELIRRINEARGMIS